MESLGGAGCPDGRQRLVRGGDGRRQSEERWRDPKRRLRETGGSRDPTPEAARERTGGMPARGLHFSVPWHACSWNLPCAARACRTYLPCAHSAHPSRGVARGLGRWACRRCCWAVLLGGGSGAMRLGRWCWEAPDWLRCPEVGERGLCSPPAPCGRWAVSPVMSPVGIPGNLAVGRGGDRSSPKPAKWPRGTEERVHQTPLDALSGASWTRGPSRHWKELRTPVSAFWAPGCPAGCSGGRVWSSSMVRRGGADSGRHWRG